MEIHSGFLKQFACLTTDLCKHCICRRLDVDGDGTIGTDRRQGFLRIGLVSLNPVRETHCNEFCRVAVLAQASYSGLGQHGGGQGIHAAADAKDEGS